MNFFERQRQAKRKTALLVVLFVAACLVIIAVVDWVALLTMGTYVEGGLGAWIGANYGLLLGVSLLTATVILGGSMYKIAALGAGGAAVARGLGATPVAAEPEDFHRRQLRNVVEEVAIASGMPVPEIYLLEQETAINAFAAGNNPSDAAIAVTRGALERLDRAELQGVIAHEFSHVANGDMRLNLKLMGWVFGILLLTLAGRIMLRSGRGNRKGNSLAAVGLALIVAGYIGLIAGRLIKASVSRERERLADASAVQFTRNPIGLAGALKKIGGFEAGSKLKHTQTEEVNHMLFASSLSGWFSGLFATHPPLEERIQALDRGFDPQAHPAPAAAGERPQGTPLQSPLSAAQFAGAVGAPEPRHLQAGAALHAYLPDDLAAAARNSDQAFLLILALTLAAEPEVRDKQQTLISASYGAGAASEAALWAKRVEALGVAARLPILELAWPALKSMPPERLHELDKLVRELGRADGRVSVFEYALGRSLAVLVDDLTRTDPPRANLKMRAAKSELGYLFSVLAGAGHADESNARRAYEAGAMQLFGMHRPDFEIPEDWQQTLDHALDKLDRLKPAIKEGVIDALATTCAHDGAIRTAEAELLRAICASLHCPLPPLPLVA